MTDNAKVYPPYDALHYSAPWWELLAAKLFGTKYDERHGDYRFVAYYWRRTFYITKYEAWWL